MKSLLALKASAGSGKTFQLTLRYLTLLLQGSNPAEILTLTFTKKAASEMQERISSTLELLKDSTDSEKYALYIGELEKSGITEHQIRESIHAIHRRFTHSDLKIMTIDAFLSLILKKFCWYAGINHNFAIAKDKEELIQKRFLQSLDEKEMRDLISFAFIENKKLKSIFDLFELFLYKETELPSFESFQYDASLESRILETARPIREHFQNHPEASVSAKKQVDFSTVEELLERGKTWLSKESPGEYNLFKKTFVPELDSHFLSLKQQLRTWYEQREARMLHRLFHLFACYKRIRNRYKKMNNELTFDDVTKHAYYLLREDVDNEFLYFRLDSRIRHILIDEFQDTSVLQYAILKPLIDEIRAGSGQQGLSRSFFYVGDVKQSIYRFRGSQSALFDSLAQDMDVEELNTNFRSKETIVNFVNTLFHDKIPGYFDQHPNLPKNAGGYVRVIRNDSVFDECGKQIQTLIDLGHPVDSIAILTFKNDDILATEQYLKEQFPLLEITTETSSKLIEQPGVKAIIELLKFLYYKEKLYLSNFLTLIRKAPTESLQTINCSIHESPPKVIKTIMDTFALHDDNCIRFLEVVFRFKSMEELMQEVDHIDESVETKNLHGIRIMTIHKSKGLEFPHVFLLDRMGGKNRGRDPLIFEYDGINLRKVWLRSRSREHVDPIYANVLEKESRSAREDLLNMLYVGCTRAEESLHIIQREEKSELQILNLEPMESGRLETSSARPSPKQEVKPLMFELKNYGRQHVTTETEETYHADDHGAIHFGLATHLYMELSDFSPGLFSTDPIEAVQNRYGLYLSDNRLRELHTWCKASIALPSFQKVIQGKELKRELSFHLQERYGQIDLLALSGKEAVIIDYKTSHDIKEAYNEQLAFYKRAVQEILNKPARCFILLIGPKPRLEEVVI